MKSAVEGAWSTWDEVVVEAMTVLPRAGAQGEPAIGLALVGVELARLAGQRSRADTVRGAIRALLQATGQGDRLATLLV